MTVPSSKNLGDTGHVTVHEQIRGELIQAEATEAEVIAARNGQASLKARIDAVEAAGGSGGPHAASHAAGGGDAVQLTTGQITGLDATLSGKVTDTRTISTSAPLTGGGNLSANRTLGISNFTGDSGSGGASGAVPAPAAGDGTTKFLKANGTWDVPPGAGGGGSTIQYAETTDGLPPSNALGADGDVAVWINDGGPAQAKSAVLLGPKASGAWPAINTSGPNNDTQAYLPYRSVSMAHVDTMPGWMLNLGTSSYYTGTKPSDLTRVGTFGGRGYSSASGTMAYLGRSVAGSPMAFFSGELEITTLPEATRFLYAGQITHDGTNLYGFCVRVDSSGVVQLWRMDGLYGNAQIGTGTFTITANDVILIERFGWRLTAHRIVSGTRDIVGTFSVNLRDAITNGYDGFASAYAGQACGIATDSSSVRVSRMYYTG